MRKMILILIMAVAFAAASLLMPATASAGFKVCVVHNGTNEIVVSTAALNAHIGIDGHGDPLCDVQP